MKKQPSLIPEETRSVLRDTFKHMHDKVLVEVYTGEQKTQFTEATVELVKAIAELTDKVEAKFYTVNSEQAKQRGITRSPALVIAPDRFKIRYIGAPVGEEGRTLIMMLLLASTRGTLLSDEALKRLFELKEPRHIQIFVSPTCPYCPQQALNAVSAAIALPGLITAEIIEMYENRDYMEKYHIVTVPFTVINDVPIGTGVRTPEVFIEEVIGLASAEIMSAAFAGETVELDLVIVGGGPGGLSAGIYAGRSGLKTAVLEKATVGGQVLITPVVENYPGFSQIAGKTLVDIMYQQALQYTYVFEGEPVLEAKKTDEVFELKTNRKTYRAKAIILVTGAEHKKLDVPGERTLYGRGVSYCATCDGYFFKDGRRVIVVGGGNSAATDALYLNSIGAQVIMVHRRESLRAEQFLRKSLEDRKIPILWNTVVEEIAGKEQVERVRLRNVKDNSIKELPVEGVFIAIGYEPNNELAKMLGLALDDEGYVKVDGRQRTSMRMVYAAGDVTGGIKQIATAVGQGSIAALTAFEDLSSPYWKERPEKEAWWASEPSR
ncbi:MAG: thioredoxin-disulfide reductase [Nitrospirota bacterium]